MDPMLEQRQRHECDDNDNGNGSREQELGETVPAFLMAVEFFLHVQSHRTTLLDLQSKGNTTRLYSAGQPQREVRREKIILPD